MRPKTYLLYLILPGGKRNPLITPSFLASFAISARRSYGSPPYSATILFHPCRRLLLHRKTYYPFQTTQSLQPATETFIIPTLTFDGRFATIVPSKIISGTQGPSCTCIKEAVPGYQLPFVLPRLGQSTASNTWKRLSTADVSCASGRALPSMFDWPKAQENVKIFVLRKGRT